MFLSILGDSISKDLLEQLVIMESEGIKYLDLREIWGKNVLELTDEEAKMVKHILDERGFKVSSIFSSIGDVEIEEDFQNHLRLLRKAIDLAKFLGIHFIRIFSYRIPEKEKPEKWREEVIERMKEKVRMAEREDIILVHENEKGSYGDTPERCRDIMETVNSPYLRMSFNPANFVIQNIKPFQVAYPILEEYISYVHIKDARRTENNFQFVPSGEGEGEIREFLSALREKDYHGFLSLEPQIEGKFSSGAEKFRVASRALKKILEELQIEYQ